MTSKNLFVYVEGDDDERFVIPILKECFKEYVTAIIQYANVPDNNIRSALRNHQQNHEYYIILADKNSDSFEKKQQFISEKFGINKNHIIIVDICIESWYVAGSNIDYRKESIENTKDITKKKFKILSGNTRRGRKENMQEILKNFDIEKAKKQSKSFKYFYENLESIIKE